MQDNIFGRLRLDEIGLSTRSFFNPPVGHVCVDFIWHCFIVKCCAQMAHCMIVTVMHLEVRLPPKIFVIKSVVSVEENQVIGQRSYILKIGRIDERMGRSYLFVVTMKADNDRNYRVFHHAEEPIINYIESSYFRYIFQLIE